MFCLASRQQLPSTNDHSQAAPAGSADVIGNGKFNYLTIAETQRGSVATGDWHNFFLHRSQTVTEFIRGLFVDNFIDEKSLYEATMNKGRSKVAKTKKFWKTY